MTPPTSAALPTSMSPLWFPELQDDYLEQASSSSFNCCQTRVWGDNFGGNQFQAHGYPDRLAHQSRLQLSDPTVTKDLCYDLARLSLTRAASHDVSVSSTNTASTDRSGGGGYPRRHSRHSTHNKAMSSRDMAHVIQCLFREDGGLGQDGTTNMSVSSSSWR